ncbi:hypothetical protein LEN26_014492 [Aphanomyces euteiches]|nr:hypothetical protein LEN26_014492 [Aphanomyces euteiches]KAH9115457.1 hypothetical protein AeMF1_010510 [Aphanomyces euteiches]KAH9183168.1 hypothetical protein AeNC1_014856 [Aphanomyces euteiches]
MKIPKALCRGDTVVFLAPASGVAVPAAHRLEQGKSFFESLGYVVEMYPSCFENGSYSSCDAETRAKDLMRAFEDQAVKAIICTIGGLTSHEMLEYMDFSIVAKNPKIFCGFSDITTLHLAIYAQADLVTFYGPSVLCQFGEFPTPLAYTVDSFFSGVAKPSTPIGVVRPSVEWTDDKSVNWFTKADMHTSRPMKQNDAGYDWLRHGRATGPLLGGCLPVLLNVFGTKYMPSTVGSILLLETPESEEAFDKGMSLDMVNMHLGVLRANETLRHVRGIAVGRAFAYSSAQVDELKRLILHHTRGYDYPIVYGIDCGHTDPIATWPLGVPMSLDSHANIISIDGASVQ